MLRRTRAAAQLLGARERRAPDEIVGALLAVQAQDLRSARLALRARGSGFAAPDVDAALADGSLVVAWLLRGTLHLVRVEDWPWLLALCAPTRFANSRRRLGQLGVTPGDADRAVELIGRALGDDGPLTRRALAERLAATGIPAEGQATPHLLALAALRGVCVMCGEQRFALAPPRPVVDRGAALAELARRYLAAHAPATDVDLAAWSGLPLRDVRRGLAAAGDVRPRADVPDRIPRRLLPAFDPYLLGWKDRSFAVPARLAKQVHPGGGMLRATATDDGEVVATWSASESPPGFEEEAADVERFLAGLAPREPLGEDRSR